MATMESMAAAPLQFILDLVKIVFFLAADVNKMIPKCGSHVGQELINPNLGYNMVQPPQLNLSHLIILSLLNPNQSSTLPLKTYK